MKRVSRLKQGVMIMIKKEYAGAKNFVFLTRSGRVLPILLGIIKFLIYLFFNNYKILHG